MGVCGIQWHSGFALNDSAIKDCLIIGWLYFVLFFQTPSATLVPLTSGDKSL